MSNAAHERTPRPSWQGVASENGRQSCGVGAIQGRGTAGFPRERTACSQKDADPWGRWIGLPRVEAGVSMPDR